jgi:hypothetical protein
LEKYDTVVSHQSLFFTNNIKFNNGIMIIIKYQETVISHNLRFFHKNGNLYLFNYISKSNKGSLWQKWFYVVIFL